MKTEVVMKFRMPKDQYLYSVYQQAEEMNAVLVDLQKFLFSGNQDLTLEDIQGWFKDRTVGLPI